MSTIYPLQSFYLDLWDIYSQINSNYYPKITNLACRAFKYIRVMLSVINACLGKNKPLRKETSGKGRNLRGSTEEDPSLKMDW